MTSYVVTAEELANLADVSATKSAASASPVSSMAEQEHATDSVLVFADTWHP